MAVTESDKAERYSALINILGKIARKNNAVILPVCETVCKKTFSDYEICETHKYGPFERKVPILRTRWLYSMGNIESGPWTELFIACKDNINAEDRKLITDRFERPNDTKPIYVKFEDYKKAKKRGFTD
jgi:hypothetical protein